MKTTYLIYVKILSNNLIQKFARVTLLQWYVESCVSASGHTEPKVRILKC